jgi:membrane protein DedA with SNARE-associated domain
MSKYFTFMLGMNAGILATIASYNLGRWSGRRRLRKEGRLP